MICFGLTIIALMGYRRLYTSEANLVSDEEVAPDHIEVYKASKHSVTSSSGLVPDNRTAIKIALAVWENVYGQEAITREDPFKATLSNGVWFVTGTLPKHMLGGVAIAQISKKDARILRISHTM
ncbi:hypothetical protein IAD21_03002 [Abditibacteriota bacterium]|nr:hypothetical protein IAD21_03002 [Abditibacteriota bacterium]